MHEFTSISVSSYDAASLADKLTDKSAEGWNVVAIVPAGTNITAYLDRDAGSDEPAPSWDAGSEDAAASAVAATVDPVWVSDSDDTSTTGAEGTTDDSEAGTTPGHDEDVDEPTPSWDSEPVAEDSASVDEPAGWAIAPEPANAPAAADETTPYLGSTTAGYETGTSSGAVIAASDDTVETPETSTGSDTATADSGAAESSEAAVDTQATTDAGSSSADEQSTAAAASAAPAGWYADPSGRYELRYWDGNQWTEHVSRAGQQYTDPPVA